MGSDLWKFAENFFRTGVLPDVINDTLLCLIPKVQFPELVTQLWLISLCNVQYKIVTKAMTNRLKEILTEVIGPFQCSFVPSRKITDNIIVYHEVLHSMRQKQSGKSYMILKIDLEKAYDRLSWSFIRDTFWEVGIDDGLVRNIMTCVETSRMATLWNGKQLGWFKPGRGIRHGDSISPYLFVLCI